LNRRVVLVVAAVSAVVLIAVFALWVTGRLERQPSAAEQAAFATRVRAAAPALHGVAAPSTINVVFGGYPHEGFVFEELLDWSGYQYAVHYRLKDSDATWVQAYRPRISDEDLGFESAEPTPDEIRAMQVYVRLSGKSVMMGRPSETTVGHDDPAVARRWEIWDFDPGAGSDWFASGGAQLIEYRDGTFKLGDHFSQ